MHLGIDYQHISDNNSSWQPRSFGLNVQDACRLGEDGHDGLIVAQLFLGTLGQGLKSQLADRLADLGRFRGIACSLRQLLNNVGK